MSLDASESENTALARYDEAMEALSSLITKRTRADKSNMGDRFDLLFDYVKGSTCTFTEYILRSCGFRTGLFTSPHLIDVRERFRLDGLDISMEKFLEYFWWCWERPKERTSDEVPMPTYFRFLALLAFKIFTVRGKYTWTNFWGKAGIFKSGVPAFTVPQPEEAMSVLEQKASELDVNLQVAAPLDPSLLSGLHLGLEGEHQYLNAGLAIALCSTWLQRTGHTSLPEEFIRGLAAVCLQGRSQIVPYQFIECENPGDLVFYVDGAHSPESMDVCAKWFCLATKEDYSSPCNLGFGEKGSHESTQKRVIRKNPTQILLFNCMSVRDSQLLLPRLVNACANHGVHFKKALFVPNTSVYYKVGNISPAADAQVDVSWQITLQRVWEILIHGEKGRDPKNADSTSEAVSDDTEKALSTESSTVFTSLPLAINWLRDSVRKKQICSLSGPGDRIFTSSG